MRLIVFSDTHGFCEPMPKLYKKYLNDGIIHLGDFVADARWMLARTDGHPVYHVRGNCDPGDSGEVEQLLELEGVKVFLTHGHRYHVKSGYDAAIAAARARDAQVLLFGHTHRPLLMEQEGLLIMNPGTLRSGEYGILEIENGKAKGALLDYYG